MTTKEIIIANLESQIIIEVIRRDMSNQLSEDYIMINKLIQLLNYKITELKAAN